MLFNSVEFLIFLPIVFVFYWYIFQESVKAQNVFILLASYVFYGWWDPRFLILIVISSFVDFTIGNLLYKTSDQKRKKLFLSISILFNLGLLAFFKYFNFFIDSFSDLISLFGFQVNEFSLQLILPVGISFYTFQTLSYSIDIYKGKLKPTNDWISFFAFVSFFPQLVAGPIERAQNLLPQFYKSRNFSVELSKQGLRQILYGLFKKIVIADSCSIYVNDIFANYTSYSSWTLIIGTVLFAFQIYGDFSGYSDIAIGTSKLFGFKLMQNFAFPYFSRDIAEFWRRWHISLSTWFRDYIYIPLGGSRGGTNARIRNTFIIFLVSGFWHGANWTFVAWGLLNALFILPLMLFNINRRNLDVAGQGSYLPSILETLQILLTFSLTVIAWIYFRAPSITDANHYIMRMVSRIYQYTDTTIEYVYSSLWIFILILLLVEWVHREKEHGLQISKIKVPLGFRWASYFTIIVLISLFGAAQQEFIYFQF